MNSTLPNQSAEQVDLFVGLSNEEVLRIKNYSRRKKFLAGAYLYHEADIAEHIFVLEQGRIRLVQVTTDGQQVILHHVSPNEAFGVIALLSNVPYPVSAQAVTDLTLLMWDRESITLIMQMCPQIALNAVKLLGDRVQAFQDRIRELATERVERRIARALLRLARQAGRKTEQGVVIDLPLTRQDLAEMTGTTLYTVSRTLSQWENQGIVQSGRERVTICFPHGLVSIAEDFPRRG
jgi:CRP-like cAMP-binding protein